MNFKKIFKDWGWTIILLFVVFGIGLGTRLYNLTLLPIFVDEAIYVRWSQIMAVEPTLRFLPLSDGKQPLYMWVLMFLIKNFSDPLFIGRLISVFAGAGTLIGIFTFSYLLFKSRKISFIASLIYAISPFSFFFDRLALVDSMLSMFSLWTVIFAYLALKKMRFDLAMLAGIVLGLSTLTKSSSIFGALLLPALIYIVEPRFIFSELKSNFAKTINYLLILLPTYLIAFAMYNIQRLGPNFHLLSSRTADYVRPFSGLLQNPLDPLIPHFKDYILWLYTVGPFPLIALFILGLVLGLKKNRKEVLVLLVFAVAPVIVSSATAVSFTARYVLFTMPYFFIIAALAFVVKQKFLKIIVYFLSFLFVYYSSVFIFNLYTNLEKANLPRGERSGYLEEWTAGHGIYEISKYLEDESQRINRARIVVGTDGYFGTLPDGLQLYLNEHQNIIVIGVGVIIEEIPQSLVESFKAGNKTYMVVNKSRFKGNADNLGLKLIASYSKALRLTDSDQYAKFGPQEELLFFELVK